VTLDPPEREFLAQFLRVAVVRLDVDRALEEERLVETVQFLLITFAARGWAAGLVPLARLTVDRS
jgi:hypothetical protein